MAKKDRRMYAGNKGHSQGCGVQSNKKDRRQKTRAAKNARAVQDQSG